MKSIGVNLISFRDSNLIGPGKFAQRLLLQLQKSDNACNYKFIVYMQEGVSQEAFSIPNNDKWEIVRVPKLKNGIVRMIFEQTLFYKYLKNPDILFSPNGTMPLFVRMKSVITIHDMLPFILKKKHSFLHRTYLKFTTSIYAKFASHIITVSNNSKNDIIKILNVNDSKISVVYNFLIKNEKTIIESYAKANTIYNKQGSPIKLKEPFLCTVSSLHPGKNIEGLIRGFALFSNKNPDMNLYIVGKKMWNYESIYSLVKKLNMSNRVFFTDYLTDEELAKVYTMSYGIIYVSYFEGFGIPPLEGFYHNKPCVVSNTSSLPEVVGNAGVYVNPYDSNSISEGISELKNKYDYYVSNIPEQINKFDAEEQIKKFMNIINTLK